MAVLSVNQINVGALIAAGDAPRVEVRDIGNEAQGADGTWRVTRSARKRDLKFKTVPLTAADALAWASLFAGEGESWSFDFSLYGSKGLGPSANVGCTVPGGSSKFGAGKLSVPATSGSITYAAAINSFGSTTDWTVGVWRSTDSGATWSHYLVRSDGAKWLNGARNDGTSTTWLTVSAGSVTIANTSGSAVLYDDLVVLPYKSVTAWGPTLGTATAAFSSLPLLNVAGDIVTEQATRLMLGKVTETVLKTGAGVRVGLEVELKAR